MSDRESSIQLEDLSEDIINPATSDKQDSVISLLLDISGAVGSTILMEDSDHLLLETGYLIIL